MLQPIDKAGVAALRRQLTEARVFEHHAGGTWLKLIVLMAITAGLLAVVLAAPLVLAIAIVPVAALPLTSAIMIGHEAGHRSFSAHAWHNELVLHLVFPLIGGLGAQHWKRKHNVLHHGHPNVIGLDDDIELWPFALTPAEHAASGRFRSWFQRHFQGSLFWPMTSFLAPVMRLASIKHSIAVLRRGEADRGWALDVACQLGHYALWLVLPGFLVGWLPALAIYLGVWGCVGIYLAMVFTPAHIGLPLTDGRPRGWAHQLASTRNLRVPRWLGWAFVGLDHQVEHHLFPTIPHQNVRRASTVLRAWCEERGAPYQTISYGAALREVTTFVSGAWRATSLSEPSRI